MRSDPDGDLLALARRGNSAAALSGLMRRHGTAIYRYCRAGLRDAALAEDIHQQVFLAAFVDLPRFAARSTLRVWLFAIARHRMLDAARRRRRAPLVGDDAVVGEAPDPGPLVGEVLDAARLRDALVASLDELGDCTRTAVLLRYQQGFTYDEMSAICSESTSTLHARVTRAMPALRDAIEARLDGRLGTCLGARRRECTRPVRAALAAVVLPTIST
jgi:RNA polymerase sigma-70 factor (ECF subfamily)